MRFSESEIQTAARLRGAGLQWDPQPGHYIFDINGVMKAGSPFQAGVYLITSPNAIATLVGGDDAMRQEFAWLPTWEDARSWLETQGVSADQLADTLRTGLESGLSDRESLYGLILEILEQPGEETA